MKKTAFALLLALLSSTAFAGEGSATDEDRFQRRVQKMDRKKLLCVCQVDGDFQNRVGDVRRVEAEHPTVFCLVPLFNEDGSLRESYECANFVVIP
jgi:hypothetical protein